MKYSTTIFFILLLTLVSCSRSIGPPTVMQIPPRASLLPEITLQHTYFAGNDSMHFFLLLEDRQGIVEVQKAVTQFTYEIRAGKSMGDELFLKDTVLLGSSRVVDREGGLYVSMTVPGEFVRSPNVMHVQFWQEPGEGKRTGRIFYIPLEAAMLEKKSLLVEANTNRPVIRGYVTTTDKLKMLSTADTSYVKVEKINAEFAPALPPMSTRAEQQQRTLPVNDSLTIASGDVMQFEEEGLYLLWAGAPYAQGLLVERWSFPDVTMARELISPLIYLTTSQEREMLTNAPDPKKAVDAFWQEVAGSTENARHMIKVFYGRVESANRLFTSHKAGWATDRGMIHIIFGKPNEINRVGPNETWVYSQTRTQPYIKFVFTKKQNNFTENHYELVRLRDYQEVWYSTVAKWRAGIIEM